jgi:putative transcriptional regulator
MDAKVIRWKLNEVMARKRIRNKDLAKALGITETSVYRLRKTDEMPRLSPERLNGICAVLECQPGELLEWLLDPDGNYRINAQASIEQSNQPTEITGSQSPERTKPNNSFLTIVVAIPESA